jgi:hypothetical protein
MADTMTGTSASVVHQTEGRVRLHVPDLVGQPAEGRRLAEAASGVAGVSKVDVRPATGSVVVFHHGAWEEIGATLAAAAGMIITPYEPAPAPQVNAMDASTAFLDAFDAGARRAFGGRTDVSELAFLGLVTAGAVQLARGEIFGPAATLFAQALTLMAARRRGGRPG